VVRRAAAGESIETLDGTKRVLDAEDLVITDDSGPIGIAGVMGGASTEVTDATTDVVIEAAHFAPVVVGRGARRHKLPSEASRRFERGVDPALPAAAAQRVADLLVELSGAVTGPGATVVGAPAARPAVVTDAALPARLLGRDIPADEVVAALEAVGCAVDLDGGRLTATPPSWRFDLRLPADLVEEVARLQGYDRIPSELPVAPAGRGWTPAQRARRRIGIALADAGYVEAPCYPFLGDSDLDRLGLPSDDPRRQVLRIANPISEEEPYLRTTLLPGLLTALRRNVSRGAADVALFETGLVFRPGGERRPRPPSLGVDRPPTAEELAALEAALPAQPRRVAAVLGGQRERAGWWGSGRPVTWADAVEAAHIVARSAGVTLQVRADQHAPWHPGRCAELLVDGRTVGHAGELHPRVVAAYSLPERTCAMELELDRLPLADAPTPAPAVSSYPAATQDVALVVDATVPAATVEAALREGAGPLLESVRLFDVYTGDQVPTGKRSLAYALRFRAPDRTLRTDEVGSLRDAAVAEATRRTGAELRGV
jgi:phenylalanyl-tRNA synthetase beta chain